MAIPDGVSVKIKMKRPTIQKFAELNNKIEQVITSNSAISLVKLNSP